MLIFIILLLNNLVKRLDYPTPRLGLTPPFDIFEYNDLIIYYVNKKTINIQ